MKYAILSKQSEEELCEIINYFISDGWRPLGGVAVVSYKYTALRGTEQTAFTYSQAMTLGS